MAPGLETPASSGNNFSSRSDSDISAGSGQLNPAARKRSTYSCTVLWLTLALRAIWRCLSFNSKYNRRTSRVLRMDIRFPGTVSPLGVTVPAILMSSAATLFPHLIPAHPDHRSCTPRSLIGFAQEC